VAPVKRALVYLWCYQRKRHHQKRPRTFDLHHNAAIRYTSEPVSTSAAMALFDAQKRLLLEKIKALEVV